MRIRNADFAFQYRWMNPAVIEIREDNSSRRATVSPGAKRRLELYAERLEEEHAEFASRDDVDISESPDRWFDLEEPTRCGEISNSEVQRCCEAFELIRDQSVLYQSVNHDAGFFIWDVPRQMELIKAFRKLVQKLGTRTPLDMPRTTDNQVENTKEG